MILDFSDDFKKDSKPNLNSNGGKKKTVKARERCDPSTEPVAAIMDIQNHTLPSTQRMKRKQFDGRDEEDRSPEKSTRPRLVELIEDKENRLNDNKQTTIDSNSNNNHHKETKDSSLVSQIEAKDTESQAPFGIVNNDLASWVMNELHGLGLSQRSSSTIASMLQMDLSFNAYKADQSTLQVLQSLINEVR